MFINKECSIFMIESVIQDKVNKVSTALVDCHFQCLGQMVTWARNCQSSGDVASIQTID